MTAANGDASILGFLLVLFIVGLITGGLARLIVPGPTPMGCLGTALAGIAGSFIAGFVGRLLFGPTYTPGIIASVLGAAVVVYAVSRRRMYY